MQRGFLILWDLRSINLTGVDIMSMYKKILICIVLLVPLSLTAAPYTKLVVFGDSLSDNGNLAFAATIPATGLEHYNFLNQPPYRHGFNNGDPAVLQLANLLNLPLTPSLYLVGLLEGNNFAVAGARAAGNLGIDLNAQVATFLASQAGVAPNDALYIIFIGGNDIRDMRDAADDKTARTILHNATHNIENALSQLHAAGANHFLVVNSPDIGKIPETRAKALASHNYHLIEQASRKTIAYNKELAETVQETKKQKDVSIVLFDLFKFFNGIVGNGRAYHFSNTKEGCLIMETTIYSTICDENKIDSFIYLDQIHPTQRVHERLGRALFAVIPEAN